MRSLGPLPPTFAALVLTASFASAAQLSVNGGVLQFFRIPVQIDDGGEKVAICHATASDANPFMLIEVSVDGLDGHGAHREDIIPAPEGATTDEDCVTAETLAGEITQPGAMSSSASDATPSPAADPIPSSGPVPTPSPTASPEPTPTASSSASATPSVSPSPTPETEPTPTPTPAETEEPTAEPTPEPTPVPTSEATPSA